MGYYFYDLETSGRDPRSQRIMQFAGIRTDDELNPGGEPYVRYVKLTDEILPEPEAVILTGITPQTCIEQGVSEAEFLREFEQQVMQPDTCIVGYNNIRFDDEFMRFTLWRNFYDAYEWQYLNGNCRWDMLDVVRMTRALRPDGINWPMADGKPINKLTEITSHNGLDHENAHDALSDVQATIDVARLIRQHQPELFAYMRSHASKKAVTELLDIERRNPVLHTSGRISAEYLNTSAVMPLFTDRKMATKIICWDLRQDPTQFADLSVDQLAERLFVKQEDLPEGASRTPIISIQTNKSPALAPIAILQKPGADEAIKLSVDEILQTRQKFKQHSALVAKLYDAWHGLPQADYGKNDAEGSLYDGGFLTDQDKEGCIKVRLQHGDLRTAAPTFNDKRLNEIYVRYVARNYPKLLSEDQHEGWEAYRREKLIGQGGLQQFGAALQAASEAHQDARSQGLITDLQLYAESIVPMAD